MDIQRTNQENIRVNYNAVIDHISAVAKSVGRDPNEIHLVVVTKTHSIDIVRAVIEAGATQLGENYIEEAIPKILALQDAGEIEWHMIGHVQGRKAREVCEYFNCMHSLDSVKLGERINRFAGELGRLFPVWLEFNVSGELTKSGWDARNENQWDNLLPDMEQIVSLPNLDIKGLMTIPPYTHNPEEARPFYSHLRRLQEYLVNQFRPDGWRELSMGMSSDYGIAIQEGATWVRIGQAILGPRLV